MRTISAVPGRRRRAAPCPRAIRGRRRPRSRHRRTASSTPAWARAATVSPPPATVRQLAGLGEPGRRRAPHRWCRGRTAATSNAPIGPFHSRVRQPSMRRSTSATVAGPTSRIMSSRFTRVDGDGPGLRAGLELRRHDDVGGQDDRDIPAVGLGHDLARGGGEVVLAQGFADVRALRVEEGVGHAAADHQDVDPLHDVAQHVELARHLGAADHRRGRALGAAQRRLERLQLGLHQPPGIGRQPLGQAGDRGVGAVRDRECVVDVEIAQRGELVGEGRVALLLAGMEAQVLEQRHAALGQRIDHGMRQLADAVRREAHVDPAQRLDSGLTIGARLIELSGLPLGRPKCDSTTTFAPLPASSSSVSQARSIRVASVTSPSCIGTLKSTRTSTRLPRTIDVVERAKPGMPASSARKGQLTSTRAGCPLRPVAAGADAAGHSGRRSRSARRQHRVLGELAQRRLYLGPMLDVEAGQPRPHRRREPARQARHVAEVDDVERAARRQVPQSRRGPPPPAHPPSTGSRRW